MIFLNLICKMVTGWFQHNMKGGRMTSVEKKARQLISDYGRDMAITQAKFFLDRANGGLQTWWQQVIVTIRTSPRAIGAGWR